MRRALGAATLVAAALFAGCYGSTEPASEIGPESARLNANGTANNGTAHSYFEYWITGWNRPHLKTDTRDWQQGTSGPFGEKVTDLSASTGYSFRMCGGDDGGGACAQTRTFTTKPPVEDAAMGTLIAAHGRSTINAHSSASGANPRGTISEFSTDGVQGVSFQGTVTCLLVNGNRAAVGAVGKTTFQPSGNQIDQTELWSIEDNHAQEDKMNLVYNTGTTPPDCASASFEHLGEPIIPGLSDFIVNDAQPSAPSIR
jgi:hypothetical protein